MVARRWGACPCWALAVLLLAACPDKPVERPPAEPPPAPKRVEPPKPPVDPNAPKDHSVWVLYNKSQGPGQVSFPLPAAPLDSGLNPVGLISADLNGDGHADLASANQDSNTVSVFLGTVDVVQAPAVTGVE